MFDTDIHSSKFCLIRVMFKKYPTYGISFSVLSYVILRSSPHLIEYNTLVTSFLLLKAVLILDFRYHFLKLFVALVSNLLQNYWQTNNKIFALKFLSDNDKNYLKKLTTDNKSWVTAIVTKPKINLRSPRPKNAWQSRNSETSMLTSLNFVQ